MNNSFKELLIRCLFISIGSLIGIALAAIHYYMLNTFKGPFKSDSFEQMSMTLAVCTTFIVAVYNTGIIGYKIIGMNDTYEEIKSNKRWHSRILNTFALAFIIGAWIYPNSGHISN
jgi:hypothetical protein